MAVAKLLLFFVFAGLPVMFTAGRVESMNEQGVIDVCLNFSTGFTFERTMLFYRLSVITVDATAGERE